MPIEIERKFLLVDESWRSSVQESIEIQQGYLCKDKERTVRVRIWGDVGKITVKGMSLNGSRPEYEYTIPKSEAQELIDTLCLKGIVQKIRHLIPHQGFIWEIDEFLDHNRGLFLAEIELPHIDTTFAIPSWIGTEVTNDHRFQNSYLAQHRIDI